MIPKKIHYCWFGKAKKPILLLKCINSWKQHMPDYQIIEWNEENFDINSNEYTKNAYKNKKWAFVSDYVRLQALYKQGGIYLDTDMYILKRFDDFLDNDLVLGKEDEDYISAGMIACKQDNIYIKDLLNIYGENINRKPIPVIMTEVFNQYNSTYKDKKIKIFNYKYFYPFNADNIKKYNYKNYYIDDDLKILLKRYISYFLIYSTLLNLITSLSYKATNKGFLTINDTNANTTIGGDLENVKRYYRGKYDSYRKRLIDYYSESCGNATGTIAPYSTGWHITSSNNIADLLEKQYYKRKI